MNCFKKCLITLFLISTINIAWAETPPSMMRSDTPATNNGWKVSPIFTVGTTVDDYTPPGILDGLGAFALDDNTVRILANHELKPKQGMPYQLDSGVRLKGARISYLDIDQKSFEVKKAGLAYDNIFDRDGKLVKTADQINERGKGLNRLCSARSVNKGQYQFEDNLFFSGEESDNGTEWVLDVDKRELWAFPAMGRGAWENVTPVDTKREDTVALLAGDDRKAAPLYLYIGNKNGVGDNSFLDRNGLKKGTLFCWKAYNGDVNPATFHGTDQKRIGRFIPLIVQNPSRAGDWGYDESGYLDAKTLRAQARERGCFTFSRPEDLHENPARPTQIAFASTGRGQLFDQDNWGTVYIVDIDLDNLSRPSATVKIIHDADDLPQPDMGIRNPDNLVWGYDGYIYVQEDRSVYPERLFGSAKGVEASVWRLEPETGSYVRIGEIERDAVYPTDASDSDKDDIGNWESSGILDVTPLFAGAKGETLLIGTVQAHSVTDGTIKDKKLVQGAQLFLMRK